MLVGCNETGSEDDVTTPVNEFTLKNIAELLTEQSFKIPSDLANVIFKSLFLPRSKASIGF